MIDRFAGHPYYRNKWFVFVKQQAVHVYPYSTRKLRSSDHFRMTNYINPNTQGDTFFQKVAQLLTTKVVASMPSLRVYSQR